MRKQICMQWTISVITVFAIILCSLPLLAYTTENVFVVVVDGLRNNEAFEDTDHDLIPHIWNDLRPQGTIYKEFYNDYVTTYTTPGHMAIVTGQWHIAPNLASGGIYDVRPEVPTIFEYFRHHTGKPKESCLVVTGKKNNIQLDWSLEPAYGPDYASLLFEGGTDDDTYALLKTKLEEHHPNLVLVNLQDVDEAGHTGDWATYTGAIKKADELVYQIWTQLIQGDALYANKTTMIVTSDHGRHDDEYGGFQEHGGMCHGCRHVMFLGIGPDTPQGLEISERRNLRDIASTVGEFLDFPMPFARGQIITGIFSQNPDPKIRLYRRNPRVSIFQGKVFVVWSQNDSTDTGNEHVFLMKKDSAGAFFSNPMPIDSQSGRWAFSPAVTANKDGLHVIWLDGRALDGIHDTWSVYYRKSPDYGSTWEDEQLIATSTFESADPLSLEIVGEPEIITNELGELVTTVRYKRGPNQNRRIISFRSADGGESWDEIMVKQDNVLPMQYNPIGMEGPKEAAMVWIDLAPTPNKPAYYNWEVFFMRTMNAGTTWKDLNRLTNDDGYSYFPMLAWGGEKLMTVWANRDVDGTPWKLHIRPSTNKGISWGSALAVPTGATSAWQPAVVWNAARSEFFLSWTDYASGIPDLRSSTSRDGQNWTLPVSINAQSNNIFRCKPHVASGDGLLYLVWEEQTPANGDWVIGVTSFGLVSHWKLDEGSGTTVEDSGDVNKGTVNGAAWTTGVSGGALNFDGIDDYVDLSNPMNLQPGTVSLSVWFKTTATGGMIVRKRKYGYGLEVLPSGKISFWIYDKAATKYRATSPIAYHDNAWHHAVGVYSGSLVKLYIDGSLAASADAGTIFYGEGAISIGRDGDYYGSYFTGLVDDLRIFQAELREQEVLDLYNQFPAGLIGHWKFDEGTGESAKDSADGNDGDIQGAVWTAGINGSALSYDGNDCVQISGLLGQPQNITLSAWVQLSAKDTSGAEVISLGDHVAIRLDGNNGAKGFYYDGVTWRGTDTGISYAGTGWHHLAYVVDDINNIQKVYVDGIEKGSSAYTQSISYAGLGSHTFIGKHGNGVGNYDFNGIIDDVRVYNKALSAQEVQRLYNNVNAFATTTSHGFTGINDGDTYTGVVPPATHTPLPLTEVIVSAFKAEADGGRVLLTWETSGEGKGAGFNVYRARRKNGMYILVNKVFIDGKGDAPSGGSYRFEDQPGQGNFYYYKLESVENDGMSTVHKPLKVRIRNEENLLRQ